VVPTTASSTLAATWVALAETDVSLVVAEVVLAATRVLGQFPDWNLENFRTVSSHSHHEWWLD